MTRKISGGCITHDELLLRMIVDATHSHIDGRDLLAELHPRKTLDIKRRVDGRETWHEGDWLSDLKREIDRAKAYLYSSEKTTQAFEAQRAETAQQGSVEDESAVLKGCAP